MTDSNTDPLAEITAMKTIAEALSVLDPEATARVLRWAGDRFKGAVGQQVKVQGGRDGETEGTGSAGNGETLRFSDLAELWAAASPNTEADRALVAGYWCQFGAGQDDFGGFEVNSALKNLGHGVSNITTAFDRLKAQKPALVMQVKKSGSSKQARKRYKLTAAGKTAVEQLIGQQE